MARSINKALLLGNLTRDRILRHTSNGTSVCDFGIATNRSWTTAQGEKREDADFHNIVAWGKLAEIAHQYLRKGRKVYVEGRLQTRSWDSPEGQKKSRTEVIIDDMILLDTHIPEVAGAHTQPTAETATNGNDHNETVPLTEHTADLDISPEEIPF
jgi:single-strand DNA-binding protein